MIAQQVTFNEAPVKVRTSTVSAMWFGGWFPSHDQYKKTKDIALKSKISLLGPLHTPTVGQTIDDRVKRMVEAVKERYRIMQRPITAISHSLGTNIVSKVAESVPEMINGVVSISALMPHTIQLPEELEKRLCRWKYSLSIRARRLLELTPDDQEYLADGAKIALGPESPDVVVELRRGYETKPLHDVMHDSYKDNILMVVPTLDNIIPHHLGSDIATYHGGEIKYVAGGHFAHVSKQEIWDDIERTIDAWNF